MKRLLCFLLSLIMLSVCALSLFSCSDGEHKMSFAAFDTLIDITVSDAFENDSVLKSSIKAELSRLDDIFSATNEDSELYCLNSSPDTTVAVSEELFSVLSRVDKIARATDGAYDYTCGKLTNLWQITNDDAPIPTEEQILDALEYVGYGKVTLENGTVFRPVGMCFDLGGAAKGYAAERLAALLADYGCKWGILSVGGNVSTFGEKDGNYKIGIRNPWEPSDIHGTLSFSGGYISVSGTYERSKTVDGVTYHHIFDAKTGKCADSDIISVAVVSGDGTKADALSTALFVMGNQRAQEYLNQNPEVGAIIFLKNGETLTVRSEYERL